MRIVAGLDIAPTMQHSKAEMINLIGADINKTVELADKYPQAKLKIHNYDKGEIREGRKMGHYTILTK